MCCCLAADRSCSRRRILCCNDATNAAFDALVATYVGAAGTFALGTIFVSWQDSCTGAFGELIMAESIGDGTALVAIGGARRAEWEGDKPSSNIVRSAVVGTSTAGSWLD